MTNTFADQKGRLLPSRPRLKAPTRALKCLQDSVGQRVSRWDYRQMVGSIIPVGNYMTNPSAVARVDPIPFHVKNDLTGLGKTTQDFRMIETTVAERRKLDSERQRKETEYQRKAREASSTILTVSQSILILLQDDAARRAALKSEISDTLKAFYCSLCEKQFQNVTQYDEHTNSYAHHHKARLRDMQANTRMTTQEDVDKRKEKERKREEKELRKIAKAAGIKMAKPINTPTIVPSAQAPAAVEASLSPDAQSTSFKKTGWATVSAPVEPVTGFKRSGWASFDSNAPPSAPSAPLPPSPPPVISPPPASRSAATPTFRTGGWTSLDVGSSQSVTLPPPSNNAAPPPPNMAPPPPPPTLMNAPPPGGRPPFPPANMRPPSVPLPPSVPPPSGTPPFPPATGGLGPATLVSDSRRQDRNFAPAPTFSQPAPPAAAAPPTPTSLKAAIPPPAAPQARSGWQQWKQGSGSKRR